MHIVYNLCYMFEKPFLHTLSHLEEKKGGEYINLKVNEFLLRLSLVELCLKSVPKCISSPLLLQLT